MRIKRILSFLVLLGIVLLPLVVEAQSPSPTPAPSPVRSLSDNIAALSQRAGALLPYINIEIVSKLIGWIELLAWVFGNCLAGFAMLRVVRNHRRAAYVTDRSEYEGLSVTPVHINPAHCPQDLLFAARHEADRVWPPGVLRPRGGAPALGGRPGARGRAG